MRRLSPPLSLTLLAATLAIAPLAPAEVPQRPEPVRVRVAAPDLDCPAIEGVFVALLDPQRGVLLLAGRAFPGGRGPTMAKDGALAFRLPDGGAWNVEDLRVTAPAQRVWYARYPFREAPTTGCVAFDRERFSSEGDVVSYVYWLVDTVYRKLPEPERRRFPAFTIADRQVRVRVERAGFAPLPLAGQEAAAMAFRFPGDARTTLLVPYVLDQGSGRLAIEVARAAELTPPAVPRESLGFVVAAVGEAVPLGELNATVVIESVTPPAP